MPPAVLSTRRRRQGGTGTARLAEGWLLRSDWGEAPDASKEGNPPCVASGTAVPLAGSGVSIAEVGNPPCAAPGCGCTPRWSGVLTAEVHGEKKLAVELNLSIGC